MNPATPVTQTFTILPLQHGARRSRIRQTAAGPSLRRGEVPAIAGVGVQLLLAKLLVLLADREARFRVLRPLVAHRPGAVVRETRADLARQVPARVAAAGGCHQGEHAAEEWQDLDNAAGHGCGDLPRIPLAPPPNPLLSGQMRYVWLHGFSSSPDSGKGRFVRERLAERGARLEIPDLNQPAFRDLTVTRMLGQIDALLQGDPVVLFGSSLGGYTAALWSSLHPGRARALVLL